jgi:hypothetical protein
MEKVKRLRSVSRLRFAIGSALALFVILMAAFSVKRYREPSSAPPEALAHIAEKNREAAIVAAAHQRAESAASTNAAEDLAERQSRGSAAANEGLARAPHDANRAANSRRD